jgi:hypothetical protein
MAAAPNIDISARLFSAAMLWASTEEVRFYLCGVYVAPHPERGAILVATDGHRLICIHDVEGRCATPAIIASDKALVAALMASPKALSDVTTAPTLTVDTDGIVRVPGRYMGEKSGLVDGTYPDWVRVVRPIAKLLREKATGPSAFNAKYTSDIAKMGALLALPGTPFPSVRIVPFGKGEPALILWPAFPAAFGLLMPMLAEGTTGLPDFIKPLIGRRKAAPARVAAKKPKLSVVKKAAKKPAKRPTITRKAA